MFLFKSLVKIIYSNKDMAIFRTFTGALSSQNKFISKKMFVFIIWLTLTCISNTVKAQEVIQEIGVTMGMLIANDRNLFLDKELSLIPDRPFVKFGVGARLRNNITVTVDVVTDLWYINTTFYIPIKKNKNDLLLHQTNKNF